MMSNEDSVEPEILSVEPVAMAGDRIASLDFIRGVAVMGILIANIVSMGQPQTAYTYPGAFLTGHSPTDEWLWVAQMVLIDGKMRGLFTLLFGAGLILFIEKAWVKGHTRMLQVRRLLWLALFGLLHFVLLWQGDILFAYAVTGLVAVLLFLDLTPREQVVLGLLGYIAGGIFYGTIFGTMQVMADGPREDSAVFAGVQQDLQLAAENDFREDAVETAIMQEGSYAEFIGHAAIEHWDEPLSIVFDFPFETLPLMLIGMAAYRKGLFAGKIDSRTLRRWGWSMLGVGGAFTLWIALATKASGLTYYGTLAALLGWGHFPRLLMTLGYLCLLVVYVPRAGNWMGKGVSAAGRAAFTNYIGTSLVMLMVFGNWGFDQFGKLTRAELYLLVVAAWAVMLVWSSLWLARFRYGPLEWLWRCLTYGRFFPLCR